ncbi:hypothetical protein [Christensenella minuta]|uniref:Uncharacterized protein n=1 Tax=Christensenella minuta TaxID=626937 RepID=A0A136Q6Y0_9FIRM|nr:hypothetical protein [Christensenella minuta]KXK66435.1 hypothetical protein HMPREF3293_00734 [Christensenella minuta]
MFDLSIAAYKTSIHQSIKLVLDMIRLAMEKETVTAELQLHSDLFFAFDIFERLQYQVDRLLCACAMRYDT